MHRYVRLYLMVVFAIATAALGSTLPASAASTETRIAITDLGRRSGLGSSAAAAVNRHGQVAGWIVPTVDVMQPLTVAATWSEQGRYRALAGTLAAAEGINRQGQIVGHAEFSGETHAVLWNGNGDLRDLGTLPGGGSSVATAINDRDVVVGYSASSAGTRAFVWDNRTGMRDLGTLGGGYSYAFDVNSSRQIVGSAGSGAVIWEGGQPARELAGGQSGIAYAISDAGIIVGQVASRPVAWAPGSAARALPTPGGNAFGHAVDVNGSGQIVGTAQVVDSGSSLPAFRAVLWQDNAMCDLNKLLSANSGWVLTDATGISDRGHIIGSGTYRGELRGFLLTLPRDGRVNCR